MASPLNLRLKRLCFDNLNEFVRILTSGIISNKVLVDDFAEALTSKAVDKLSTNSAGNQPLSPYTLQTP